MPSVLLCGWVTAQQPFKAPANTVGSDCRDLYIDNDWHVSTQLKVLKGHDIDFTHEVTLSTTKPLKTCCVIFVVSKGAS